MGGRSAGSLQLIITCFHSWVLAIACEQWGLWGLTLFVGSVSLFFGQSWVVVDVGHHVVVVVSSVIGML